MTHNYFITIGRQFGSNGDTIGKMLAQKLNMSFYDKELINIASEKSGIGKEIFEKADEKSSHSIFGGLFGFRNSILDEMYAGNYLCNETLFEIQSEVIRDLSKKDSAVFVGRCADYILKEEAHKLDIFIHANLEDRIKNVTEKYGLSEKESATLIQKQDKQRAAYYNYYTSKKWGDAASYDLCINASAFSLESIVDSIAGLFGERFGREQ